MVYTTKDRKRARYLGIYRKVKTRKRVKLVVGRGRDLGEGPYGPRGALSFEKDNTTSSPNIRLAGLVTQPWAQ